MPSLPPLAAIRAFEAAARHANYTRAGEELGLTQAAVSYQIKSLEQRLGTVLFVRSGRQMHLTAEGAALAPQISRAFQTMENAFAALGDAQDAVLSIACFQTFATQVLAPRLGTFQLEHPDIAVRLDVSNAYVDLEAGESDLALRWSNDVAPGLVSHPLMRVGVAPFASPDLLSRQAVLSEPEPIISTDCRISPGNVWWEIWDEGAAGFADADANSASGVSPQRGLQFDSQLLDAAAAASGNGVAILAPALFASDIASGRLVRLGQRIVRPDGVLRLVYPEVRRHSPKVRAFRRWLDRELEPCVAADPGCDMRA